MAKINKAKDYTPVQPPAAAKNGFQWNAANLVPLLASLLYFAVHFLPDFGAYDAMGSQWLYIVVVDILVIMLILARRNEYQEASSQVFGNLFSKLYLAFFALAGVSIFTAINPTESLVCYVRLTATIVAFFNISILLYKRTDLFRIIGQILALILLVESSQAIAQFLREVADTNINVVIMGLKGTTGNKNIFAASTVVKIPFVLYCIYYSNVWGKILNSLILLLATLTLFFVNARASYVSLILIVTAYVIYCIWEGRKKKKTEDTLYHLGYIILPVIAALFISQVEISAVKNLQEQKGGYGTVTERLGSVVAFNAENNQVRFRLWAHAIDYTLQKPILGCGYGNWKIASIPYQRTITTDLIVPVHAHNDFFEAFAEMGIPGGVLYLSLFACILFFTAKTFLGKASEEIKLISLISFLAFIGYSVDAFFNFPMERPISQIFFVFITVWNITAYVTGRQALPEETDKATVNNTIKPLFGLVSLLLLIPSVYVTYETYRSLVLQKTVLADLNNEPLKLNWKETAAAFPSIPNLTATAQPVDAIKGRYLYEAGQYEEAIALLDKGRFANPTIAYSEFLKAGLYYKTGRYDSAVRNATYAFSLRPKAKTYYQTLIAVLAKVKDTSGIKKAFAEYDRYRHEPLAWDLYLRGMLNAQGKGTKQLLSMADSAVKMFANQEGVTTIATVRDEIIRFMENPAASKAGNIDVAAAARFYNEAVASFGGGVAGKDNLEKAASLFLKSASLNPGNYVAYENAAICFFNMKQWQKSITYFNKVLATQLSTNGKPEYFKGVALFNLGQREEGCNYLKTSLTKGWKEAEAIIKANCK